MHRANTKALWKLKNTAPKLLKKLPKTVGVIQRLKARQAEKMRAYHAKKKARD